jgi:hypothetical protein
MAFADGEGLHLLTVGRAVNLAARLQVLAMCKGATRFDASLARISGQLSQSKTRLQVLDLVGEPGQGKTRQMFSSCPVTVRPDETGAAMLRLQREDILHRKTNSSDHAFRHVLLAIGLALESRSADRSGEFAKALAYHFGKSDGTNLALRFCALAGENSLGGYSLDAAVQFFATAPTLHDADPGCAADDEFAADRACSKGSAHSGAIARQPQSCSVFAPVYPRLAPRLRNLPGSDRNSRGGLASGTPATASETPNISAGFSRRNRLY